MDPVTLIAGAVIAMAAFGLGNLTGRRRTPTGPPRAICEGCEHGLSFHDEHGKCHGTTKARAKYVGEHTTPCTCVQYVGEIPAERILASFTPPRPLDKP
ncbi:hypothetical protein ABZ816_19815 [Actinosynnema sp. NPDC047251]|uniref:Putative membrane protein n=1 Tax=Saccharothrix espanaensis (strain ATCC 51144 / DSM 44229 / JCM 9112 / NBRC 15066 / NRRL 15764) TaxID=1179773 RepID=K0KE42_SACES|nr:hypothetical protein [Saccharothrix espanaensis]CCH34813.1 putative membrane protein [Saccharothrix espanaensis DSM 44229]